MSPLAVALQGLLFLLPNGVAVQGLLQSEQPAEEEEPRRWFGMPVYPAPPRRRRREEEAALLVGLF